MLPAGNKYCSSVYKEIAIQNDDQFSLRNIYGNCKKVSSLDIL